jgi:arylsulfatase A-like enzyme/PKD repeat protein
MKRSPWMSALLAASTGLVVAFTADSGTGPPAEAATNPQPNILLINLDDMRPSGGTLDVMPHVRSFFQQQGQTFTRNYPSSPLCSPSRGSLFTGRYGHNNGITGNGLDAEIAAMDQSATWQGYLHAAGYSTAMAGKFMNTVGLSTSPKNWDHWTFTTGGYTDVSFNVDGTVRKLPGYYSNVLGDAVIQDLDTFESQNDAKPWLIYVAPQAPHDPFTAEAKYASATVPAWTRPPSFNEADVSDKPSNVSWRPLLNVTTALQRRTDQLRTLMSVDDMVGRITDELARLGEDQNTLAIFTSDNGYLWGEHRVLDKRMPYTDSETTPLLVRWIGHVPAGTTSSRLVSGVDMLPTLLEAAGVSPALKAPLDGTSMVSGTPRSELLVEYGRSLDAPLPPWSSVVTPTAQYTEWYDAPGGAVTGREYYDLVNDPDQLVNLLGDAGTANDPDVGMWSGRLAALRGCAGAQCVVTDETGNAPPQAAIGTPVVNGLAVSFSAAGCSDSDGRITGYRWEFGDGATGTGVTPTHTYAAAGTYQVTLTVTDDEYATGTATRSVVVGTPTSVVAYRAGTRKTANATKLPVTVPAAVRAGDALLLVVSANRTDATLTVPAGWTRLQQVTDGTLQSVLWWRVATATDPGSAVTVTASVTTKTDVQLLAYSGAAASPVAAYATGTEPATTAAHKTPTVSVAAPGSWVVQYWADKTGTATGWTAPATATRRLQSVGAGGGHVTSLSVDSGGPVPVGTAGGRTATSSVAGNMAVMWTVVLAAL